MKFGLTREVRCAVCVTGHSIPLALPSHFLMPSLTRSHTGGLNRGGNGP